MFGRLRSLALRILDHYTAPLPRDSIEYWQSRTFHGVALAGLGLGYLCLIPGVIVFFLRSNYLALFGYIGLIAFISLAILHPRLTVRIKAAIASTVFFFAGFAALLLGGPAGQRGLGFSACVIVCSLYVGLRPALGFAGLGLAIGLLFGFMNQAGFHGWINFPSVSLQAWILQSIDIFLVDLMLAIATTVLIRGMGESFRALVAAEAKDRALLAEKETLIRELYHRTKNNMQVISAMLKLHSRELESTADALIFKEVTNKITAMSMVHQMLYESQDLSRIDAADYIGDLVRLLAGSYRLSEDQVTIRTELEPVRLLVDTAVPLGVLISEMVSNSLKYAFPDGQRGTISISLKEDAEHLRLSVADDGVGLPAGFQAPADGRMGMKTLFTMVEHQLQGSIVVGSDKGLSYEIRFKGKLYDERVRLDKKQKQEDPDRRRRNPHRHDA